MSKRKYKRGKLIRSVAEFEKCESAWYIVYFGTTRPKTIHRSFLESWQYRTLKNFINKGEVFIAVDANSKIDYEQITIVEIVNG